MGMGFLPILGALAAASAQPAETELQSNTDMICLGIVSRATGLYRGYAGNPATSDTRKAELDKSINDLESSVSWFWGRVTALPADQRKPSDFAAAEKDVASVPDDEVEHAADQCYAIYRAGREATLFRLWSGPVTQAPNPGTRRG